MELTKRSLARRWVVAVSVLLVVLLLVPARAFAASKPAAPTVQATFVAPRGETKLTWNKIGGAATYQIYRSKTKEGGYSRVHVTSKNYATWTDASLSLTGYWYKVRAVASDGTTGDFSTAKRGYAKIGAPSVTGARTFAGNPTVTFKTLSGAEYYEIYRSASKSGTYTRVSTKVKGRTFTDENVSEGSTYWYKVRGVDGNGIFGNFSAPISMTVTPRTAAEARPVLEGTNDLSDWNGDDVSEYSVFLRWKPVEGAVRYKVYRSTSKSGTYTFEYTVSGADIKPESFYDGDYILYWADDEQDGNTYWYKVYAQDGLGTSSSFSNKVSVYHSDSLED